MRQAWTAIEKNTKNVSLFAMSIFLFVIGILGSTHSLFLLSLLICATLGLAHLYHLRIGEHFQLATSWKQKRLFPGEEVTLLLQVRNEGSLPVQVATWGFSLSKRVEVAELAREEGNIWHTYLSPFSLKGREGIEYQIAVTALQRGVIRVEDTKLEIEDPLGLGKVTKEFLLPKDELVVYPSLQPITGLEYLQRTPMGDRSLPYVPYEDPTYVVGARPYRSGDPFGRIDWKATAKKQELHTKVLDRTAHTEWVLVGNVRSYPERWRGINEEYLERTLSVIASISHHAVQEGMPFQAMMNMKPIGRKPAFRIPSGIGRKHLIYTLEALARVTAFSTFPFEEAVHLAHQEERKGKGRIVIVVTPFVTEEIEQQLVAMRRQGIPVYLIRTDQEETMLQIVQQTSKQGMKSYA